MEGQGGTGACEAILGWTQYGDAGVLTREVEDGGQRAQHQQQQQHHGGQHHAHPPSPTLTAHKLHLPHPKQSLALQFGGCGRRSPLAMARGGAEGRRGVMGGCGRGVSGLSGQQGGYSWQNGRGCGVSAGVGPNEVLGRGSGGQMRRGRRCRPQRAPGVIVAEGGGTSAAFTWI